MPSASYTQILLRYTSVAASVVLAAVLRLPFHALLGNKVAFITLFPAILYSAWIAGLGGGFLATALSGLIAVWFILPPVGTLVLSDPTDQLSLLVFILVGIAISILGQTQNHAQREAETSTRRAAQSAQEAAATLEVLRESEARTTAILESITDAFLALDCQWRFTYVNDQANGIMSLKREQVMGRNFWEVFPHLVGTVFDRQYHRAMEEQVPVSFETFYPTLNAWLDIRAYPSPGGLSVFFQNINARKAMEQERERRLAEQFARAEREALLNRIGTLLRSSLDPESTRDTAVSLLGEALGADRCYFALYNLGDEGTVQVTRDWHRADLPSIQGTYSFSNTAEMFRELYQGSSTSVVADARTAPLSAQTLANMERLQIRSRVSVALADAEGLTATLTAAMSEGPRDWTTEEVALVEAAATQLRSGVEAARLRQREHKIAEQLQDALLPTIPPGVPGLRLGYYYRAALNEAGIGGDFAQVFSTDKGISHLVVGDLAGKGLAAAGQIATVTNMLRFAVRSQDTLADAVSELNTALADDGLLSGFATLFVGRYDAVTGELTYVNCGQEAGLVLRASTGALVPLPPTGPVLGMLGRAKYTEQTVRLTVRDVLAVYTDGLTEAGPSRAALLTGDGVADLLREMAGVTDPQRVVEHLITGVDTHAGSGIRDDQCLLVGIVTTQT